MLFGAYVGRGIQPERRIDTPGGHESVSRRERNWVGGRPDRLAEFVLGGAKFLMGGSIWRRIATL